jgi:type IV pilus assembly protein PilY1
MVGFKKIILFIIVSIVAFQAQAKNPPPGTGTSNIPANILIMLDNSGSMSSTLYSSVQVYNPLDVATDSSGNVYVMEYYNNRIKVFSSSGSYLRSFGSYGSGCNQWQYARQFTIYNNIIYLADTYGRRIKKLSLTGGCISNASASYSYPHAIAVSSGYVFVGHAGNSISTYTQSLGSLGNQSISTSYLNYSWGMSLNPSGTKLIIGDYVSNRLLELNVSGNQVSVSRVSSGIYSSSNGYFRRPTDAAYDSGGNIYVVDHENHRLQKLNSSFSYQAKVGSLSTTSAFYYPYGMHVDSSDNIYAVDFYNYTVRKFNTSLTEIATYGGRSGTRLDAAKKVIKKIVSDSNLTSGANFGLMEWGTRHNIRVKISDTGAKQIYSNVDGVYASGGTDLAKAMNIARNYFTSGQVANWNLTCSLNFLIVISDGAWSGHSTVLSIANQLRTTYSTQTFAVGFALSGANSNYNTLATAGGTTSPLYASNETELLQKLSDAIKQAISGRLTFTTPAVMSDVTRGDFVYQSTFTYEKDMQWKGSLKKYQLNADGSFGTVQWDAADKLNAKSASARNIWTSGISVSGINNFTTSNRDDLKSRMFPSQAPTDLQTENLINFIRGVDVYDQDGDGNKTESIHKLADIYHSELVVVGPPEASALDDGSSNGQKKDSYYRSQNNYNNFKTGSSCGGPCPTRKEVVFAGANNGIVHAFDTSNGEELWGFIPPSVIGNLEKIPSSKANTSNAIYGVDGSPVVKDIYFDDTPNDGSTNPRWRTVLLGGLGSGGQGLYALDITDINNPKHLFAINQDGSEQVIQHWGSDGFKNEFGYRSGSIDAKYDYRKLGETWSTPRIIRIKVSGKDKWVAVFGGGYNGAVNPNYGSAVFVMDLEDEGRLLKVIDIEDQANVMKNYVFGTVANNTQTEFNLASYGLSSYDINCCTLKVYGAGSIRYAITGDQSGTTMSNLKLKFDEAPPGGITIKVSMVNKTDIVNSLPADLTVITADGTSKANYNGALVYATDLEGKITKINLTDQGTLYQTTTLFNAQSTSDNGRYIYTRPEATINNDSNLWLYFGTGNTQKLQEQSTSVQNRVYGIKDVNFPNFVSLSSPGDVSQCKTAPDCPGGTDLGWYVNLSNYQKLSAEPTVDRDRVYFPIYEPNSSSNKCNTGIAYLNGYDTKCGNSVLNVNMGKGVLSKVVKQGNNLYIGLSGEVNKNIAGFTSKDNLITGKSGAKSVSGAVQLESWKENY